MSLPTFLFLYIKISKTYTINLFINFLLYPPYKINKNLIKGPNLKWVPKNPFSEEERNSDLKRSKEKYVLEIVD